MNKDPMYYLVLMMFGGYLGLLATDIVIFRDIDRRLDAIEAVQKGDSK